MSKILFIANEPSILSLIENLQPLFESTIEVEADYSNGIKRIFEDQPDVVFFQNTINNVSCEKPVSQVKALLDQETTSLILLTDDAVNWNVLFSAFDHCLDMYQPSEELSRHIQQLLAALPSAAASEPAAAATEDFTHTQIMEFELPSGDLEPFGQFPTETADDYARGLQALTGDAPSEVNLPTLALPEEEPPTFLASFLSGQFEPLPSFVFDELPPEQVSAPLTPASTPEITDTLTLPLQGAENQPSVPMEKLDQYFGSQLQEVGKPFAQLATASGSGPSQKQTAAQEIKQSPSLPKRTDDRHVPANGSFPTQKVALAAGGARKISPTPAQLANATAARIGVGKNSTRSYRGVVLCSLLVIGISSAALAWFYFSGSNSRNAPGSSQVSPTAASKVSTPQPLPEFIPRIAPDSSYAAEHPGWERYRADAVEYLVFRENGQVRAVQVVSEQQGAISVPFLKTCIRTATGFELSEIRFAEARKDGIEVLSAVLASGVELAIYRKIADSELRGFVLSFPAEGPAHPDNAQVAK